MQGRPLQESLRQDLGLRVGPQMADYVSRQLALSATEIPVIASDAKTGIPVRTTLKADQLRKLSDPGDR